MSAIKISLPLLALFLLYLFSLYSISIGDNLFALPPEVILWCLMLAQAIKQHRAFSIVGPFVWNSLPSEIRFLTRDLSSSFYKLLKTFIFARAWAGSAFE